MEEYIEMCSQFGSQAGMTNEEMKAYCEKLFPEAAARSVFGMLFIAGLTVFVKRILPLYKAAFNK